MLGALRQNSLIPSASWGYLAGAAYYTYPRSGLGSLTLGGYDASRLKTDANLTLAGGSDPYRPFLLGIESITTQGKETLTEPIITALDSLTTQLWLPLSVCQAFEAAFNLVWNETYQLYLLNEDEHSALAALNASVTFLLSTGISNSIDRLEITLPYAAFDLKATPPLAGNQTYFYFPLKRAANETQYTLGRTILQEIYIVADYEGNGITLYEASYPESSVESNIITLCPPNSTTCFASGTETRDQSRKLSTGATAGIVIAVVLVLTAIGVAIWFKFFRKPSSSKMSSTESSETPQIGVIEKPELGGEGVGSPRSELGGKGVRSSRIELDGYYKPGRNELVGDSGYNSPSGGGAGESSTGAASASSPGRKTVESGGAEVVELSAGTLISTGRSELPCNFAPQELPGSMSWPNTHSGSPT